MKQSHIGSGRRITIDFEGALIRRKKALEIKDTNLKGNLS